MLKCRTAVIVSCLILLTLLSGCTTREYSISDISELELIGVDGEIKTLTLEELLDLPSVTGRTVYQNSYSFWQGKGEYTGVPLSVFAELMGGIIPGDILIVSTVDNYTPQIFSYHNIYPSDSINQTQGRIILAYKFNDTLYPSWSDGLRIAFLPPDEEFSNNDSQVTASLESSSIAAGPRWAKFVNKLEFRRENKQVKISYSGFTYHYSLTQFLRFPSVTNSGRIKFHNGTISEQAQYTGVNLSLIAQLASHTESVLSVEIHSSNGELVTLNSTQLNGKIPLYNSTGSLIEDEIQITFLISFELNDEPFSLVVVGSDSPISDSGFWVAQVEEIIIIW